MLNQEQLANATSSSSSDESATPANPSHATSPAEELLETALFHGLNLVAGYARYSGHVWSHEGVFNLKVAEIEFVLENNKDCRWGKKLKHITSLLYNFFRYYIQSQHSII